MKEIVFLTHYAGFAGGIERYIFQVSAILRRHGYVTRLVYVEPGRDYDSFIAGFDRQAQFEPNMDFANAELITVHKFADTAGLEALLAREAPRLALFAHDHDFYCPRHHKYTPCGRVNCYRPYRQWRCALCASTSLLRGGARGNLSRFWREAGGGFARRLALYRRFPRVVALSHAMLEHLRMNGFAEDALQLVAPAVAPALMLDHDGESAGIHLLFVGQLIRGKGVEHFLRMMTHLPEHFVARIIGDGNDRARLERLSRRWKLTKRVEFSGWRSDPELFYRSADIVVFPSLWQEPFGLVGLEAAAHGIPVVAYDIGGCREWLRDGVNGMLAKAGCVEELAQKVEILGADSSLRRQMGAQGRKIATEEFSEEQWMRHFEQLCLPANQGGTV